MKKLILTPEEKEQFDKFTKEEQEKFFQAAEQTRKVLMLKAITLCTIYIETLDDLENFGMMKSKMKVTGKQFKDQLLKYSKEVFSVDPDVQLSIDFIAAISDQFDNILREANHILEDDSTQSK